MFFKTKIFNVFFSLLSLFILNTSYSQSSSPLNGQFSTSLFKKGTSWTWHYYESGNLNKTYSEEKYTVLKKKGPKVTFLLSSRVGKEDVFSKRYKFKVNLRICEQKWKRRNYNPSFVIKIWQRVNETWTPMGRTGKSLLFEEKFNCNSQLTSKVSSYSHPWFGENSVVGPSKEGSFYFEEGPMKGVLSHKFFNPGTPHFYLMLLKESTL